MLWDKRSGVRRLALDAVFLGLALMLSYLEFLFPIGAIIPLPGFKLGLANLVILLLALRLSMADALTVSLLRVSLSSVLFGSATSLWFSFMGAVCSLLLLALLRRSRIFSFVGLSVLSAAAHNLGQLIAASVLFGTGVFIGYLPFMAVASVIFGGLCGLLLNLTVPRLDKIAGGHA